MEQGVVRLLFISICKQKVDKGGSLNLPSYNLYTSINTEIGDGEYKVYECRDDEGGLRQIIIDIQ